MRRFKRQFNGYDCQEVKAFLLDTEANARQQSSKDMVRILAYNQNNRDMISKIDILFQQLIAQQQAEHQIVNQVLAQVQLMEKAYLKGRAILAQAGSEAETQLRMLENNYQRLREINAIISHVGMDPIHNGPIPEIRED